MLFFLSALHSKLSEVKSWLLGPGLGSLVFASSFCYGFWIQHIWIPGPRCVVATATSVPLVNNRRPSAPEQRTKQLCDFVLSRDSNVLPPLSLHTRVSRQGEGSRPLLLALYFSQPLELFSSWAACPRPVPLSSTVHGDHPISGSFFSLSLHSKRAKEDLSKSPTSPFLKTLKKSFDSLPLSVFPLPRAAGVRERVGSGKGC